MVGLEGISVGQPSFSKEQHSESIADIFKWLLVLVQPPQGRGGVLISGGFHDVMGQGARYSHLGSLSHERLGQIISGDPFQPGLFCVSVPPTA